MPDPSQHRAEQTHRKIARSASVLEQSAEEQTDSADRRTELAMDRTLLAAERTYAAWVRTGLAALAAGVGAKALLTDVVVHPLATVAGAALALFSAFCFVAAVWRELRPRYRDPRPDTRRLPAVMLVGFNGLLVLVAFAAVWGIVASR